METILQDLHDYVIILYDTALGGELCFMFIQEKHVQFWCAAEIVNIKEHIARISKPLGWNI